VDVLIARSPESRALSVLERAGQAAGWDCIGVGFWTTKKVRPAQQNHPAFSNCCIDQSRELPSS